MPKCKCCQTAFSSRATIDGKKRFLGRRKYCLSCSPFGAHNTKVLVWGRINGTVNDPIGEAKLCACGREFIPDRSKGHSSFRCNSCYARTRKVQFKNRSVEYKGGKCEKCDYNRCVAALVFHHVDHTTKSFTIAASYNRKWEEVKKELDKCILLCANCHAECHYAES